MVTVYKYFVHEFQSYLGFLQFIRSNPMEIVEIMRDVNGYMFVVIVRGTAV